MAAKKSVLLVIYKTINILDNIKQQLIPVGHLQSYGELKKKTITLFSELRPFKILKMKKINNIINKLM